MGFSDIQWQMIVGGLALFLFGMNLMGDSLTKFAGNKLRDYIEKYTTNPFMAVAVGIIFTGLIQSSSGTTVIAISLVRSGYMKLEQAIAVILGANVGTTVTAILIGFDVGYFSYFFALVGVVLILFASRKKLLYAGEVLLGFGMLFIGLNMMGDALAQLQYIEGFEDMVISLSTYPIIATIVGALITAVVQSSSAVIGIVQVLYSSGAISLTAAIGLIFGANIGTTVTAALAGLGGSLDAKRTSLFHFLFKVMVSVIFLILISPYQKLIVYLAGHMHLNALMTVALAHFVFNALGMVIFIPIIKPIVKMLEIVLPGKDDLGFETKPFVLDKKLLQDFPLAAMEQINHQIEILSQITLKTMTSSREYAMTGDDKHRKTANSCEELVNQKDTEITSGLVELSRHELSEDLFLEDINNLQIVKNLERISDLCQNLTEYYEMIFDAGEKIPKQALEELNGIYEMIIHNYVSAVQIFRSKDQAKFEELKKDENNLDLLEASLRDKHLKRLATEYTEPNIFTSIFVDILSTIERIGDHSFNIALNTFNPVKDHELYAKPEEARIGPEFKSAE